MSVCYSGARPPCPPPPSLCRCSGNHNHQHIRSGCFHAAFAMQLQADTLLLFSRFRARAAYRVNISRFNLFTCTCRSLLTSVACCFLLSLFGLFFPPPPSCCFCLIFFFFCWCHIFWFSILKSHEGTRTHARLPSRPVPPPKPRRSKKGVSRSRFPPTALFFWVFSGLFLFVVCFAWSRLLFHFIKYISHCDQRGFEKSDLAY